MEVIVAIGVGSCKEEVEIVVRSEGEVVVSSRFWTGSIMVPVTGSSR